ncbi:amidohydrolase family protein [Acidaminobacter sp. JC074]|uniref:amidohydrolase family protein n=1 Tax=Acidaminobacter sp. JC074 TaxID=2530199 RepID=UPI001F0D68A3|nr:amidohydrolase family protein [Acidaminobacter sp. JC074]
MIVLKNCHAYVGDKEGFIKIHIYVENESIIKVAEKLEVASEDQVIDVKGLYVTPGLIEPHCHIGLKEHGVGWAGSDENEDYEPIQDKCHVIDGINMLDKSFDDFRRSGITSVGVFPGGNCVIGGYGAAIKCKGKIVDEAIIQTDIGLKASLGGVVKAHFLNKKKMPLTRMGIMSLLNQFVMDAKAGHDHKGLIEGQVPFVVSCERLDDIHSAIRFAKKHDLKLKLVGLSDYDQVKELLNEEKIEYALGPIMDYASAKETIGRDRYRHITGNDMLTGSLTTCHPSINGRYASLQASIMVQNGLDVSSAINAMTLGPAAFLGIEAKVGSLEAGKDADLVIWDGHPLELNSKVLATMIDGEFVYKGGDFK